MSLTREQADRDEELLKAIQEADRELDRELEARIASEE